MKYKQGLVRIDGKDDGSKVYQEDFCQLSELPPSAKYDGSGEGCAKIINRFASEPSIDLLRLFEQLVFSWWVGNGDLHLKNLSLMVDRSGDQRDTHNQRRMSSVRFYNSRAKGSL